MKESILRRVGNAKVKELFTNMYLGDKTISQFVDEGIMCQLWFEKLPTNDDAHIYTIFLKKKTLFDLAELADKIANNYDIDHTVSAIQSESKKDYPKELESRLSKLYWKFDSLMNDRRSQSDFC